MAGKINGNINGIQRHTLCDMYVLLCCYIRINSNVLHYFFQVICDINVYSYISIAVDLQWFTAAQEVGLHWSGKSFKSMLVPLSNVYAYM